METTIYKLSDEDYAALAAEIKGKFVELQADGVKSPKYLRYGWAVFMTPNLVNEAGLPTAPCAATDGKAPKKKGRNKRR